MNKLEVLALIVALVFFKKVYNYVKYKPDEVDTHE